MDIGLARTFLAIVEVGNFVRAADQLFVTQSTVSTRVKLLEDLIGQQMFVRSKAGATLTPAGGRFKPFAEKLIQTWEHARQDVGLPPNFSGMLTVGVEFTLWERLLVRWLPWIKSAIPDIAIRTDVGSTAYLSRMLIDGLLDVVVTYTPQQRSGLVIEQLMEEHLVLVSSHPAAKGPDDHNYIYVDWGPEFRIEHMEAFPEGDSPILSVNYGPLALQHILANGGSAYLPIRLIRPLLDSERLFLIPDAESFTRHVFAVYFGDEGGNIRFETAVQGLKLVSELESEEQ